MEEKLSRFTLFNATARPVSAWIALVTTPNRPCPRIPPFCREFKERKGERAASGGKYANRETRNPGEIATVNCDAAIFLNSILKIFSVFRAFLFTKTKQTRSNHSGMETLKYTPQSGWHLDERWQKVQVHAPSSLPDVDDEVRLWEEEQSLFFFFHTPGRIGRGRYVFFSFA